MIAAMMTAANLGARVTGWGFVVFTLGSICWSLVGFSSNQTNLLATNAFLTLVNLVGIWRWLGRQRAYEDGGKAATEASRRASVPTLFTATGVATKPVVDEAGTPVGTAVEALIECRSGEISYVVVASGGIGGIDEHLRAVPRREIEFGCDCFTLLMTEQTFLGVSCPGIRRLAGKGYRCVIVGDALRPAAIAIARYHLREHFFDEACNVLALKRLT